MVATETPVDWLRTTCQGLLAADSRDEIKREFDELARQATQSGLAGANARQAVCFILLNAGRPFSDKHASYAQECAAATVNFLCKSDQQLRKEFLPSIETALTATAQLPPKTRRLMLGALMHCTGSSLTLDYPLPPKDAGKIVAKALDLESKRETPEQYDVFQEELLFAIRILKSRDCIPMLDAIYEAHTSDRMRAAAKQISTELRDSILLVWDETTEDQLSTPEQRVLRLTAIRSCEDEHEYVQTLFSTVKGYTAESENDQVVHLVINHLTHHIDRVELAACIYLIEDDRHFANLDLFKRVASIIADKSVNIPQLGLVADSLSLLNKLEARYKDDKMRLNIIALAKQNATMQFLSGSLF
jgi:hypothetical protein